MKKPPLPNNKQSYPDKSPIHLSDSKLTFLQKLKQSVKQKPKISQAEDLQALESTLSSLQSKIKQMRHLKRNAEPIKAKRLGKRAFKLIYQLVHKGRQLFHTQDMSELSVFEHLSFIAEGVETLTKEVTEALTTKQQSQIFHDTLLAHQLAISTVANLLRRLKGLSALLKPTLVTPTKIPGLTSQMDLLLEHLSALTQSLQSTLLYVPSNKISVHEDKLLAEKLKHQLSLQMLELEALKQTNSEKAANP